MPRTGTDRLARLQAKLRAQRASGLLVSHLPNVFYLSGFTGESAMLLVERRRAVLYTDPRFAVQARQECSGRGIQVEIVRGPLSAAAGAQVRRARISGRVFFEEDRLTVAQLRELKRAAKGICKWKGARGQVESLREVKDRDEIAGMRQAAQLGCQVMQHAIRSIRPGMTELELAAEIEYRMRKLGASGPSFETIVASGPRAARPHGIASSAPLPQRGSIKAGAELATAAADFNNSLRFMFFVSFR